MRLMAQVLVRGEPNISYICSRYYRAPELIFGATDYTTAIDLWSVGCVMAELLLGQPLFPGESGVDQLVEIIKVPTEAARVALAYTCPHAELQLCMGFSPHGAQGPARKRMGSVGAHPAYLKDRWLFNDSLKRQPPSCGPVLCITGQADMYGEALHSIRWPGMRDPRCAALLAGAGDAHAGRHPCDEPQLHGVQVPAHQGAPLVQGLLQAPAR